MALLVVLALLVAIASGTVLAATAGARRGASALDRLLDQTLPAHAVVTPFQSEFDRNVVRDLPQVEALATYSSVTPTIDGIIDETGTQFTPTDSAAMSTVERPVLLAGRLADPARAAAAVVTARFVIGLLFGIPLGLALGRTVWRVITDSTPLHYVPPVAFWALVLIVPLALVIVNLLAAFHGQRAARLPVTQILRAE